MTIKSSGLWCDLCNKPLLGDEVYWHIGINGKEGHSCDKCKTEYEEKKLDEKTNS